MKAKNKLLLLAMYVAVLIGFASIDSLAATSAQSGNWNSTSTWVGGVLPTSGEDVTIDANHTVVVNLDLTDANGNRSVGTLTVNGTLRPDAGVRNIEVDNDLVIGAAGQVNYNYLTTGRLNWTFTGVTDGASLINNNQTTLAAANRITALQFHNVAFAGAGVNLTASNKGFVVYGDMTVSALSSVNVSGADSVMFSNTAAKSITNNNILQFSTIHLVGGSAINYNGVSGSSNIIGGNITIGTSSTFTAIAPSVIDLTGGSTVFYNSGNFNFNSGTELNISHAFNMTISTSDINNFNGALTFGATTITLESRSINGTGSLTTNASSIISLANATGVKGALNLTGTRTFNAATSYTFTGASDTGFNYTTGNDVTSVGGLTITGATTTADSFTITGTLSGAAAFTASAGTITSNGATIGAGGGAKTFNNLTVAGGATLAQNITVAGSLVNTSGTLAFSTFDVTMTGTGTLTLGTNTMGAGAQILINGASSNVTLGGPAALGATGNITLNNATAVLDMAGFAITGTLAAGSGKLDLNAGTVRSSGLSGLSTNLSGLLLNELTVTSSINYEFYGSTITNLGFDLGGVTTLGTGGTTGIQNINNLTLANTSTVTTMGAAVSVAGNITVNSGATFTTGALVTMNGDATQTITNNAATSAALTFTGLTIGDTDGDAEVVTTASSFTMAGALTMTGTNADTFTATAGTITFGAGGDVEFTAAVGVLTLYNATVSAAQTWLDGGQSAVGNFRIDGNLLSTVGAFVVDPLQDITFRGFGKTINVTGGTMNLGDIYLSGSYTTNSAIDITIDGDVFNLTGSLIATSPSSIVFTAATLGLDNVTGGTPVDSLVFFDVSLDANTNGGTEIFTVLNDITTTDAFDGTGGTIKIMGEPTQATVTASTTWGNVIIPVGKTLEFNTGTSILAGTSIMTLNGTLQVNTVAQLSGTGLIAYGNNSTVILDGPVAGGIVSAISASGTHTFAGSARVNLEIGPLANNITTLGLGGATGTLNDNINNLTLNHTTSAIANFGAAVTMYGNFSKASSTGTVALADAPTNQLTLAGTSKTFTNLDAAADLTFDDVVISGSYSELATSNGFGVGLAAGSAGSFTVNTGASWTSTLATNAVLNINSTTAAALVVDNTAPAGTALFNNFTVGANSTSNAIAASYTVQGNYTKTALGNFDHTSASTVTLAGTGSITNDNDGTPTDLRTTLTFGNLTVTGSYTASNTASGFAMVAGGILTVSGTLNVNSGTVTAPAGGVSGLEFVAAGKITGSGTINLGALVNTNGDLEILTGTTVTVDGDVAGALTNTTGNIFGRGTSTVVLANGGGTNNIVNGGTLIRFANLEVAANAVVTNNVDFTVNRDITLGSGASFVSSAGTITLDSAGTSTITNNGTLTFFNLTVANTAGNNITTASDFNVANTMLLGAANVTFTATAGTVTFNGGAQALTDNSTNLNALTFYNLTKSGTGALTYSNAAANNIAIKGDITTTGSGSMVFTNINGDERMFLNGTTEQNIVIGTTAVNAIDFGFLTINNQFGVKLVGATTEGDIQVYRTLRLQSGDLDLNGNSIVEIIETNGLLSETSGNTIINSGTAASVGYVYVDKASATFTNNNMNGIGVNMTTSTGSTMKIKRYSIPRNVGSVDGITRVFSIVSGTTTGLDAKAVFRYDDSELNGLTAAALKITRTDDQISGPWYLETSTVNTTNRIITVEGIDGFASGSDYEYWTATAPVTVTTAELTKGLVANPLVAGRTSQAIYGLEFSANGDVDVNEITFGLDRDVTIANEFSKYYLVKSGDNDYATTDDNTVLISGTNASPATLTVATAGVTFDVSALDQMITADVKLNYFLVVDINTNVTTATAAIGATFNETNLDITNGIAEAVSENGTDYTFKPGLMIDQISNGLTQSPLIAGTTNNGLIGFQMTSTSNATEGFDTLFVGTNVDVTEIFSAVRLVRSTTNDVTTGTLTTVKTGVISADGIAFNNLNENATTTARFYFLVGDVKNGVDRNTSSVLFTIADEDLNDDAVAGPRYINAIGNVSSSFSSPSYSFAKSEVTVSQTTPLVAQSTNLGRGVNNQPVFRFTLASDNGNNVSFTKVVAHATLAKGLTSNNITAWRLWYDANGNDYPDTGEQISTGTYNAAATQGNLTFDNFTSAQTTNSSRKYIVTVNLAVGTTANSELRVALLSQSYVTVTSPAKVNAFSSLTLTGALYTVKAPGTATTAKIVGLSTNSVISGGNVSFTVRAFDASDVPANVTASTNVSLNVAGGGFTFGGTTTGTILAGGNFVSITPTMSHATGTTTATVTATLSGGLALTTAATQNITVFKSAPSTNGTVTISTVTTTTMQLSGWTAGTGGSGRIVVISATTPPTAPTNGVTYTANTNIGSGGATAQTGPGSFVVATGASAVTTISGLTPGVTYYVQVFEYDGSGSTIIYNTSSKTSVAVDNAGTITGNPAFKATTAGSIGGASLVAAVNISTDVDVTASITSETEAENGKWFKFKVNSNRNNFYIKISDLPANYSLYLYDNTTGNELLFRTSEALSTTNDAVIVNNATAGEYLIRVFGADNEQYDASTFGLKVVTSASEVMSLEE